MGDLTLFEALTGGAFDRLNWQHSGEFDQNFSKKSNALGFARGGGMGGFGIDRYITWSTKQAYVSVFDFSETASQRQRNFPPKRHEIGTGERKVAFQMSRQICLSVGGGHPKIFCLLNFLCRFFYSTEKKAIPGINY